MSAPERPRDSGHFPGLRPSSPGLAADRTSDFGPGTHPRRTMPPPELLDRAAPASVGALVLENIRAEAPVSRHTGPVAEETRLRAALTDSRARSDVTAEREA